MGTQLTELSLRSTRDLLALHADILEYLRRRGVIRSANNPVADYAEYLVAKALSLTLTGMSNAGFDGRDADGRKYEIKARRLATPKHSRMLSAIRGLDHGHFDLLVGVLFGPDLRVFRAALIPARVVLDVAKYREHTNAHIMMLADSVWLRPGVVDVTEKLRAAENEVG